MKLYELQNPVTVGSYFGFCDLKIFFHRLVSSLHVTFMYMICILFSVTFICIIRCIYYVPIQKSPLYP